MQDTDRLRKFSTIYFFGIATLGVVSWFLPALVKKDETRYDALFFDGMEVFIFFIWVISLIGIL